MPVENLKPRARRFKIPFVTEKRCFTTCPAPPPGCEKGRVAKQQAVYSRGWLVCSLVIEHAPAVRLHPPKGPLVALRLVCRISFQWGR